MASARDDPRSRTGLIIFLRLLLTALAWGAFYLSQLSQSGAGAIPPRAAVAVLWTLGAAGLLNVLYLLAPASVWRREGFRHLQLAVDILLVSGLVYLTGGARSLFVPFYFASILAACFWLSERAALGYASAAAILLSGITVVYTVGAAASLPFLNDEFLRARGGAAPYGYLVLQGASTFIVAFLGGRLASGLRRAEQLNDVILGNLTDGVIAVDRRERATFANSEASRILGFDEALPDVQRILTAGEIEDLGRVLAFGGSRRREIHRAPREAGVEDYEIRITALRGARGGVSGAILVFTDLTTRKRMEEALLAAERLQSSAELAAGIAHEIRNPLASVRACAQELARSLKTESGDDARMLKLIVRESDHVNRIVSGVIDFAKPLRLQERPFDLKALLTETVEMARLRFAEVGGESTWEITIDAPSGMTLTGDPDLLSQAFMNLAHNALQAMEFGGGKLRIAAALAPDPNPNQERPGIAVVFADTGPGIRPEHLGLIFDPFFTTKAQGTGLGLAVSQRIAQAHGGGIRAESEIGKGTRMVFWLPARATKTEAAEAQRR